MNPVSSKPVLSVLDGHRQSVPPVWMMRQAGRYLPEYRELRATAGTFLDLCFTPKLAAEVTLQPIRRFGFDAAILFSDILVVPHAFDRTVTFETGEGPRLDPITEAATIAALPQTPRENVFDPVYETIRRVKAELPPAVTLLGFCGAPWTVATYMIAGRGTPDQAPARLFAYREHAAFTELVERLTAASVTYLVGQLRAGADAVQVFDTWSGILPRHEFERWCIEPMRQIVANVRAEVPDARFIGFPRGAGTALPAYAERTGVNAVGLDWMVDPAYVRDNVQTRVAVQGNLDPLALLAGGAALDAGVDAALAAYAEGRFVFNLGHGILPQTPIAHVERMLARVRGAR